MLPTIETVRGSSWILLLVACVSTSAGCDGSDPGSGADGGSERVRFELGSTNNGAGLAFTPPFFFETDTAALAGAARDAIGQNLFVSGCITQEPAPYNDAYWGFQFVSILGFVELAAEVCDANIEDANADWDAYFSGAAPCDTGGVQLCAWNSRVVREVGTF